MGSCCSSADTATDPSQKPEGDQSGSAAAATSGTAAADSQEARPADNVEDAVEGEDEKGRARGDRRPQRRQSGNHGNQQNQQAAGGNQSRRNSQHQSGNNDQQRRPSGVATGQAGAGQSAATLLAASGYNAVGSAQGNTHSWAKIASGGAAGGAASGGAASAAAAQKPAAPVAPISSASASSTAGLVQPYDLKLLPANWPQFKNCSVQSVQDGDTVTVKDNDDGGIYRIRFFGIDAPETKQLSGPEAGAALQKLLPKGCTVTLYQADTDQYGRTVGLVVKDGIDINLQQVMAGNAWLYFVFIKNFPREIRTCYEKAFDDAKRKKVGLWGRAGEGENGDPLNPREWRKAHPREKEE